MDIVEIAQKMIADLKAQLAEGRRLLKEEIKWHKANLLNAKFVWEPEQREYYDSHRAECDEFLKEEG